MIGGDGVGDVEPIGAQTDRNGIGLNLETPADVIGGPGKGEGGSPERVLRDRHGRGADDSERSVRGEGVGIPGEARAWDWRE